MARIRRGNVVAEAGPYFIYFVQAETLRFIKIGRALDLGDRMKTLQVGCPDRLILLGVIPTDEPRTVEKRLHYRFRDLRHRGEWFSESDELLAHIKAHAVDHDAYMTELVYQGLRATYPEKRAA